jgi:hypothetical protein
MPAGDGISVDDSISPDIEWARVCVAFENFFRTAPFFERLISMLSLDVWTGMLFDR